MDNKSITIVLTPEQINQVRKYTKEHFSIELEEENIAIFFKLMIEEMFKTFNIEEELTDIEERIHKITKGTRFTLSDLYTISEWKEKDKIKKVIGKIFYLKVTKDKKYRDNLGIMEISKNSSNVQRYEKI